MGSPKLCLAGKGMLALLVCVLGFAGDESLWAAPATNPVDAPEKPAARAKPLTSKDDYCAQLAAKLKPTRIVVYKKVNGRELHLHIFDPADFKPTDHRACFITIHGGGWVNGSAPRMYPFADHAAQLGLVGISVEYRLLSDKMLPKVTVFDCVKDGRSAVRYVRAHASELGIDPDKIIASGGSAGGHVAAATALCDGIDEAGEDTSVSCVPNALVLYFSVIDCSKEGYGNAKIGEKWKELSPLHLVHAGLPPTILFHSKPDKVVPYKGAAAFNDAMHKAGNRCELVTQEEGAHGYLMRTQPLFDEAIQKTDAFLREVGMLSKEAEPT